MEALNVLLSQTQSFDNGVRGNNVAEFISDMPNFTATIEELGFQRHYGFDRQTLRPFFMNLWYRGSDATFEAIQTIDGKRWTYSAIMADGRVGVCGIDRRENQERYMLN